MKHVGEALLVLALCVGVPILLAGLLVVAVCALPVVAVVWWLMWLELKR